jgi:hypothetical protein
MTARSVNLGVALAAAAGVLAVAIVGSGSKATADYRQAEQTKLKVRQLLGVQYSTKYCDESGGRPIHLGYKVNAYSRRWHRQRLHRRVPKATFLAQINGLTCSRPRDDFNDRKEHDIRPCFGCDGFDRKWTPDYFGTPRWPYVFHGHNPAIAPYWALRFRVKGKVRTATGQAARLCTRVTLFGRAPSC